MSRRPHAARVWIVLALLLSGMGFAVEASAAPGDPMAFFTVEPPCRVFDSRELEPQFVGDGPALSGQTPRLIPITGSNGDCVIPAEAEVAVLNVTVTQPTSGGKLFVGSGDDTLPSEATEKINFKPGETKPNNMTITLDASGQIKVLAEMGAVHTVHVIVDVSGYYAPAGAVNDAATVEEDAAATAIDVLANDLNPGATITSATQPANGTVVLTGGSPGAHTGLTYEPDPDYCNTQPGGTPDTFDYTINPGNFTATVSVTVTCVADDPTAEDDTATTNEDTPVTIDVRANDTDPDGDPIVIDAVTAQPANGTAVNNGGVDITYTPNANYCNTQPGGTPDTFTYTLTPGGDSATVSVTVTCSDGSPEAVDDTATTDEDTPVTIDVRANDTDEEGDPFTIDAITAQPANGTAVNNGGTDITYTPNADYCNTQPGGTPDTFTYTLTPGGDSATVSVTVTCVNDNPRAENDTATTNEDTPVTIDVRANDTDPEGDSFTIDAITAQPANGTAVNNGGTDITYTPNANYCNTQPGGTPDTFTYTLTPGGDSATVSVTVTCVNDNPVAADDTATTNEDTPVTIDVRANDTDPDGDSFTIDAITAQPANGTAVNNGGVDITYTPNLNYCNTQPGGTPDTFTYTLTPGGDSATVSVTVTCVNDNPVAVDDTATTNEDTPVTIDVRANDTDADGDSFTIDAITAQPANGTAVNNGGVDITYTPNLNYCNTQPGGTPDTFTYSLTPGGDTATVSVTVTCVDDNPVAVDDTATTNEDTPVTINVRANDTDAEGDSFTVGAVTAQPTNGTAVNNGGVDITYTPSLNYCNTQPGGTPDTFTYSLSPGGDTATVSVTVTCVDDPATAVADAVTVDEDSGATTINVQANDTDVDGGTNTITLVTQGSNGSVAINPGGATLAYTPNLNYCNTQPGGTPDTFTYTLSPGGGPAQTATVSMTVTCLNDAPIVTDTTLEYTALGNTQLRVGDTTPGTGLYHRRDNQDAKEKTTPSDVDGPGPLDIMVTDAPDNGQLSMNLDGTFTYLPNAGFEGADTFKFRVRDHGTPEALSNEVTVTITVSEIVWYVHDVVEATDNPAAGDTGQSTNAFEVLSEAVAAAKADPGDDDYIFVFAGNTAATPHTGGFVIDATGTKLHGEGIGLTVPEFGGSPLIPAGAQPRIDNNAGNGIQVNGTVPLAGVQIRGLAIEGSDNAVDVTATGTNGVGITISNNTVTGGTSEAVEVNANGTGTVTADVQNNVFNGGAGGFDAHTAAASQLRVNFSNNANILAAGHAVNINGAGGGTTTVTGFSNNSVHSNTTGSGVLINAATFDANVVTGGIQNVDGDNLAIGAPGVGNGAGQAGMLLTSVQGSLSFDDLDIFADNGTGLQVGGTGSGMSFSIPPSVGIIEATNGPAVDVSATALVLPLSTLRSTTTGSTGVSLVNVSDGTVPAVFSAGSGSSITTTAGAGGPIFNVSGGNASITYGGTITNNGTGRAVSISTWTGDDAGDDILFSGAIDENGAGILVNGNGGTSRSITFSGGLDIDTTTGEGFAATSNTNTGGLHITGTNTIDSVSATGLRVTDTTIGNSDLNFQRISSGNNTAAADPASGIVLTNTGALGGLKVTGTGASGQGGNASGGLIQSTTSHGIALTNTREPSFANMSIQSATGNGVNGTQVTDFTFDNGTINVSGTVGAGDTSNIAFNAAVAGTENNVAGVLTVTDSILNNAAWHGVDIQNFNGTLTDVNISNNALTSSTSTATSKGAGIRLQTFGSGATAAHVTKATLANNVISNFPSGAGIMAQGGNSNAAGPAGTFGTPGSANVISITGNRIAGASAANRMGTSAILSTCNGKGQCNVDISSNGTVANPLSNVAGTVIGCAGSGNTTSTFVVNNNVVVANNTVASNGIGGGTGTTFGSSDTPNMTWTITGNNVSATDGNGILAVARGATGTLNVKIQNNTVAAPLSGVRQGIRVDAGNAASVDDRVCANISGNTTAGSGGTAGIGLRKQGTTSTTNDFAVHGMAATSSPGVEQYVGNGGGQNPGTANGAGDGSFNGVLLISAASGFGNCSLP